MRKFLRDKSSHIIFICVLLIQIIFMIFYCDMKKGYFVDELWSYGLSNSYYHAQIWEDGALDNPEISPDMFKEYMTVNEGEAFKFGSVIYNQTHDSHPPLFIWFCMRSVHAFRDNSVNGLVSFLTCCIMQ